MSTLKVNNLDTESGTTITVTTGKTVVVPSGATLDISAATLTPPAVMPASSAANLTNVPGANITGTIPSAALGNVDLTGVKDDIALLAFKTQANGSLARYNLVDQSVDAFEDASGVDASASTNEARNASNYYYGETSVTPTATGGTITVVGDYTIHSFLSSGNFITDTAQNIAVLVVGGGGQGGGASTSQRAGGGGAGGVRVIASSAFTAATHAVVVGAGGYTYQDSAQGTSGANSSVNSIVATGGGGGGYIAAGSAGGSGGGGGSSTGAFHQGGPGNAGSFSPVEGYAGGAGDGNQLGAGGGGGAGEVGESRSNAGNAGGGKGGDGIQNDYRTGSPVYYGGGGGGDSSGAGGQGGGATNASGTPLGGTVNTGGGGAGGTLSGTAARVGGSGGSGIVVLKRPTTAAGEGADMTLVSNAQTAQTAPTKGDLVMTISNGAGTTNLNVDVKAYISRDGSAYTSAVTLVSKGTTAGHQILTANDVDLSGIATGTSMRWKIETLNQSAAKTTRIQAVSLGWS